MKFVYAKEKAPIVALGEEPFTIHTLTLEGSNFKITASEAGVFLSGTSPLFQPVEEEMAIPDEFREFMVRLSSAFTMARDEQKKNKKDSFGRQMLLGLE